MAVVAFGVEQIDAGHEHWRALLPCRALPVRLGGLRFGGEHGAHRYVSLQSPVRVKKTTSPSRSRLAVKDLALFSDGS